MTKMLELCPVTLKTANEYVKEHHRHHGAVVGHKFSIGATKDGVLVGVAICGRPVSRVLDDGYTLEAHVFAQMARRMYAVCYMAQHIAPQEQWVTKRS